MEGDTRDTTRATPHARHKRDETSEIREAIVKAGLLIVRLVAGVPTSAADGTA
jgi:hypothetical protein